jgi:ABC-type sugar transport system ATPase subunit
VIAQHSVTANIELPVLERVSRHTWLSDAAAAEVTREQVAQLRIKTASASAVVNTLSGGNQQKVVVGKWLATTPAILVLDEPTAGVDIGAKSEIVRLVRELARAGRAVLLISSEMPVLLAACDRIVVMSEGRIVRDIARMNSIPLRTRALTKARGFAMRSVSFSWRFRPERRWRHSRAQASFASPATTGESKTEAEAKGGSR